MTQDQEELLPSLERPPHQLWEYQTVRMGVDMNEPEEGQEFGTMKTLDGEGIKGWELCAIQDDRYTFKRPWYPSIDEAYAEEQSRRDAKLAQAMIKVGNFLGRTWSEAWSDDTIADQVIARLEDPFSYNCKIRRPIN